jgi:hypothetical protein
VAIDPIRWSERSQGLALVIVLALYFVSCFAGPGAGPIAMVLAAGGLAVVGGLSWRFSEMPWREIASWTVPIIAWNLAILELRPPLSISLLALLPGGLWVGLFACWSPFVPWWYRSILRRPFPFVEVVPPSTPDAPLSGDIPAR